jgi:transposase, IS30 family
MKKYRHLSDEERFFIHVSLREGKKQCEIAASLGRHPSTISREIRRSMWQRSIIYCYDWALWFKRARKRRQYRRAPKIQGELEEQVRALLKKRLSPEQVSGYLMKHHQIKISHETIYRYIYSDFARKAEFKPYLRHGKKRRKKYGSGARASNIPNRVCITQRPAIVETRERLGDWECDTVIGSDRKSALVTLVDRKSLFTLTQRVKRRTARNVSRAITSLLKPYQDKVHTLTFDNGSEFVEHEKVAKALNAQTYFAHPYSSWERGVNENTNGLLRQFFPKGTDFNNVGWREIRDALTNLNTRPRKTRGYQTPEELFLGTFSPLL